MVIFTSICANYLHKARSLAQSVKRNIPDAIMVVCLVEREILPSIESEYFDEIVLAKDAWDGNFNRFIFKHSIVEASTAVKGQFMKYLMTKYTDEDKFVYLDPDVYVYDDFIELKSEMEKNPIIVCPHLLYPGNIDMELSSTAHGVYNLGFLAITRSVEGKKCLDWWAERLYLYCYDDILHGVFTDQKWFDLAPCFFDVKIFKHHGYDFAPWSLKDSTIEKKAGKYYINGDPLRFIHYSGYGQTAEKCMKDWLSPEGELFKELYSNYSIIHETNDSDNISKTPWSYSCYYSGEKIDNNIRKKYRNNWDVMFSLEDPFSSSNRKMKRALSSSGGALSRNLKKSYIVLKEEGVASFLYKARKHLFGKNK